MDPIVKEHHDAMNDLIQALMEMFPGKGVTLMVFDFGGKGRMNYISNANRVDMLTALKEFIAVHEGRRMDPPDQPQ